ncbi:MAG: sigma factor-like helix-turn-helix DNA-binding protein [Pseudomonadota bacterium]
MAARRFDTDALLEQLLEHKENAFKGFYERYRGRVYRFIVRQCGNGEEGQAEYISIWANLIKARLSCKDGKCLKLAFLESLRRPTFKPLIKTSMVIPFTLMPRELEEEGGWSTLLVEMVRRLPEGLRKRFLFRYEIGLSHKAIATVLHEDKNTSERYINEAERKLFEGLENAGCKMQISLDSLYRETRSLGPPASWDQEVLSAYPGWLKNGVPDELINLHLPKEPQSRMASIKAFLQNTVSHLRADISAKIHNTHQSTL